MQLKKSQLQLDLQLKKISFTTGPATENPIAISPATHTMNKP
jgi:hypothetical protein